MSKRNSKRNVVVAEVINEVVAEEVITITEEAPKSSKSKAEPIVLTTEQATKLEGLENRSQKIRFLLSITPNRSSVAKHLGIRYQHVRNVEITPIKRKKTELTNA